MSKAVSLRMSFVAAVAAAMVALLALSAGVGTAWADGSEINVSKLKTTSTQKMVYFPSNADANTWYLYGDAKGKKFSNVTSTNKSVVTVKNNKDYAPVTFKKAGKAVVKFKYNGKNYKITFSIIKYTNPVKVFKVGKTNFASKFKKSPFYASPDVAAGAALKITPTAAWKLDHFEYYDINTWKLKSVKSLAKYPKNADSVSAVMKHKKTGTLQNVTIMSY